MKSLDLHIIDITHNSIRAGATEITIEMEDSAKRDLLSIKIIDNGCGMPEEMIEAINDRFYSCRKERKIGMGIALLKFHSELCNGKFYLIGDAIESQYTANNLHFAAAITFIFMVILLAGMGLMRFLTGKRVYAGGA